MAQSTTRDNEKTVEFVSNSSQEHESSSSKRPQQTAWHRIYAILSYTPPRCRYDPDRPFEFSMGLNLLFAFASCFTVANLYYTHPILNKIADTFHVTDEQASYIPTLAQAGYAAGLLFLCPLGDLLKRRPFVLWLVWFTATMWIGLCITNSFAVFGAISFITCVTTVTPQLMLPLVGDMAPPHRRATSLSIIVSGLLLGMLMARVLSGIVTEFIGWRYIYWIALGLQYFILILLWLFMPDYPSTNPDNTTKVWRKYPGLLLDILKLLLKHPVIVQACLIGFFTSSTFTSYWTTLTFLLAGSPYHYNNLIIGCFGFLGIVSMTWGPLFARLFMEKHQPLLSIIIGELICATGIIIGTYSGLHTVAGPVIQAVGLDVGLQTTQIGNRMAIYAVVSHARNRVNTAYMVSVFCGQLMGTAAGNHLYAQGGWILSGSASVGFIGASLVFCLLRGPHETGWVGWHGGAGMRKIQPQDQPQQQQIDEKKNEQEDEDVEGQRQQQQNHENRPDEDNTEKRPGSSLRAQEEEEEEEEEETEKKETKSIRRSSNSSRGEEPTPSSSSTSERTLTDTSKMTTGDQGNETSALPLETEGKGAI